MLWLSLAALPVLALFAVERISYQYPNKRGYRRVKARWMNRMLRNEFKQTFPIPQLRDSFGPICTTESDISDHLSELFYEVVNAQPRLIVELGTRGGESTRALLSAAQVLDARVLSKLSSAQTASFESGLARKLGASHAMDQSETRINAAGDLVLPVLGKLPSLAGLGPWFNSPPLTNAELKGKVVLIDFWTYSCINCLRTLPYLKAWDAKYRKDGLVIIGIHAPEFAFEHDPANVAKAVQDLGIRYPVALDNKYLLWNALHNQYWPAHYFVDAQGRIRDHHFGEGDYAASERVIQTLLGEAGYKNVPGGIADPDAATGEQAAADDTDMLSPETYIGYARAANFAAGPARKDIAAPYQTPYPLAEDQWGLAGRWTVQAERAVSAAPGCRMPLSTCRLLAADTMAEMMRMCVPQRHRLGCMYSRI